MRARIAPFVLLALAAGTPPVGTGSSASAEDAPAADPSALDAEDPEATFAIRAVTTLDEPWAMTFLPDGRMLITEKPGRLLLVTKDGQRSTPVAGVPEVDHGGQGGLGDVVLHPEFADNALLYLSYAEAGDGNTRGAAVVRARLVETGAGGASLEALQVIWRQTPKVSGRGHYGHRLVFGSDSHLFVTSGDRQKFTPAQDMAQNLGKIVRLQDDGSLPADNPFADAAQPESGGVAAQVWTLGHRNPLGIAFTPDGRLWSHEMGPRHGDELNRIEPGNDYGYPTVSNGDHYDGRRIPDHSTRPEFTAPAIWWKPAVSPAGLMIYTGSLFPDWQGNGFMGGLSGQVLLRIAFDGERAREAQRFDMGARIREVEQGPDGAIWLLEDGKRARLLRLSPAL
jgi:glucose/arabinose dehydrogenase